MVDIGRLVRRGLWFFVGVLLSTFVTFTYAAPFPATGQWSYPWNSSAGSFASVSAVCAFDIGTGWPGSPSCLDIVQPTAVAGAHGTYTVHVVDQSGSSNTGRNTYYYYSCPAGSSGPDASNMCTPPTCPTAGASAPDTEFRTGSGLMPSVVCVNGCGYKPGGVGVQLTSTWATALGGATGTTCTSGVGTGVPADSPTDKCLKSGQGYGTVNDVVVCTGPASTTSSTTSSSANNPAPGNGAASTVDTTTNTVCTGAGSCTTTTTTTTTSGGSGPGGTGPGSTTTTDTKDEKQSVDSFCAKNPADPQCTNKDSSFCEENPTSQLCKEGSFSGACGAEPACTGDAVQCAQASAAWKIKCNMETEPNDAAYQLGKTIAGGGADTSPNPLDPANIDTIDVGSIISTAGNNRTLTASCIPSPSFSVMGNTYTMDTTILCQFAEIVGFLMVAASAVIAVRIVTAGGS